MEQWSPPTGCGIRSVPNRRPFHIVSTCAILALHVHDALGYLPIICQIVQPAQVPKQAALIVCSYSNQSQLGHKSLQYTVMTSLTSIVSSQVLVAKVGAGTGDGRVLFSEEQVAQTVNRVRTTAKVAILTVISTATPCTEVFPAFCK